MDDKKLNTSQKSSEENKASPTIVKKKAEYKSESICDYCRDDISDQHSIRCAECSNFEVCVRCFASGSFVAPHESSHEYRVTRNITESVFDPDWTAEEEILLLKGIKRHGIGNWTEIKEFVGTKSKLKCEAHYENIYFGGKFKPFPESIIKSEQIKYPNEGENIEDLLNEARKFKPREYPSLKKFAPPKPKDLLRSEVHASLISPNVTGFMPDRGDFELEYDNEAEKIVAEMEFNEEDSEKEKKLKLEVLRIYNSRIQERKRRKVFLIERGIYAINPKNKRKYNAEEKQIFDNMKCFARFHSNEQHERLVKGLCNELRIRKRIELLQNYRLQGHSSMIEAKQLDAKRSKSGDILSYSPNTKTPRIEKSELVKPEKVASDKEKGSKLTKKETQLCEILGINEAEFLSLKDGIKKETYVKGMIDEKMEDCLVTIKVHQTPEQLNYIIYKDWEFPQKLAELKILRKRLKEKKIKT